MPRAPRSIIPGLVYHLISRFIDREWFIRRESERRHYLHLLGRAIPKSDWRCLGYCVMNNHLHIAALAGKQSLSSWVRRVHSPFADFINKQRERIGPVFVRGPRAFETPTSDVARLIAYVHNNPVRAGVVAQAADSTWSSHRAYLGLDRRPSWLDVQLGLELCGFSDRRAFDRFVSLNPQDPAREALERDVSDVDESALFREALETPAPRRREAPCAHAVVEATAKELGLEVAQLCSPRRSESEQLAREVAVHCASTLGITGVAIAHALTVSQSAASLALRRGAGRRRVIELSEMIARRIAERATHATHA